MEENKDYKKKIEQFSYIITRAKILENEKNKKKILTIPLNRQNERSEKSGDDNGKRQRN